MNYEFHPAAETEFLESAGFYESRVPGLGEAFITEVEQAIKLLCDAPRQRPVEWEPDIRRAPLHRFPYSIVYRAKDTQVQVLAVAHSRRRPLYWLSRA